MSFQGINFSSQHIVPSDDGRLYEAIFEDGALHGCELSYVGAALTIGAGYLMIGGREIEITEDEVFNINEATSGYAQLVLTIDLTQTATIGAFNQVSIDVRYASTEAGFASLIQDDINGAGTKYQQQLALVSLGTGGITGIVAGMPSSSLKGAGRVFSIIAVTYPEGSLCTCSDGTTTLTARDTSGKALFNVPSAGTWTVTVVNGYETASKTIDVIESEIYTVELGFGIIPYTYQQVEYLQSNGSQYVDTGIKHSDYYNTLKTVIDAQYTSNSVGSNVLSGAKYSSNFHIVASYNEGSFVANNGTSNLNLGTFDMLRHTFVMDIPNGKAKKDDTTVSFNTKPSIPNNILMLAFDDGSEIKGKASAKIFSFKMYSGETLIRDFIPCYRKSDSVSGFWDLVSKTFFTNSGSGEFIVGGEI